MRATLAILWLALVIAASTHLGVRFDKGIELGTDLLALLRAEGHEPALQRTNKIFSDNICACNPSLLVCRVT